MQERIEALPLTETQKELAMERSAVLLDPDYCDKAIISITSDGSLIYDKAKLISIFAKEEECSEEESAEHIAYNTERALAYMPDPKPILSAEIDE